MSIYSQFAIIDPTVKAQFENPSSPLVTELRKLARELHANFGLCIERIKNIDGGSPQITLLTQDGLACGRAYVTREGINDKGENSFRYTVHLPTIRKTKASSNSPRDARDSNSLASLIRALKKNKEAPTDEALYASFLDGMRYTIHAVRRGSNNVPSISLSGDTALAVIRNALGVDAELKPGYITELRDLYVKFQSLMKSHEDQVKDVERFHKGATVICVAKDGGLVHYLVGEAGPDTANGKDQWVFQGKLKRYQTLAETPLAPTVAMIRTYMQGQNEYDRINELGISPRDHYYSDIDVAVGYSTHGQTWVAIPKHAE